MKNENDEVTFKGIFKEFFSKETWEMAGAGTRGLAKGAAVFAVLFPLSFYIASYFGPETDNVKLPNGFNLEIIQNKDRSLEGTLNYTSNINLIDTNADGTADFIKVYFRDRGLLNPGPICRCNVPNEIQNLYKEAYNKSKFYKEKK